MAQKRDTREDEVVPIHPEEEPGSAACNEKRPRTETSLTADLGNDPTCDTKQTVSPTNPTGVVEVELPPPIGTFTFDANAQISLPTDPDKEYSYHIKVAETAVELMIRAVTRVLTCPATEKDRLELADDLLLVLGDALRLMAKAVSTESDYNPDTWMFDEIIELYHMMIRVVAGRADHPVLLLSPLFNDWVTDEIPKSMGEVILEMIDDNGREELYAELYERQKSRLSREDADAIAFSDDPLTVQMTRALYIRVPLDRKNLEE